MNDQSRNWLRHAPGEPVLKGVNWGGLRTLYINEVRWVVKVLLLSFLGLLTSLWAAKFDHAAAVTNFVVTPLSLLSGTFYSVKQLAPAFQRVSHANPFFYVISGFRAGFLGASDSPLWVGGVGLLVLNTVLWAVCYQLLKSGWKIKN